jgi:hypothetical protein
LFTIEAGPGPRLPKPECCAPYRIEKGCAPLPHPFGAGGEHDQLSLLGRLPGSEDGRVDVGDAVLGRHLRQTRALLHSERTRLDPHTAFAERREHAFPDSVLDGDGIREHGDHELRPLGSLSGTRSYRRAVSCERVCLLRRAVPDAHLHPCREQIARHRGAHDAGSEYGDGGVL